jgi:branched-chain amino acid transport system ATP-binding protein
MLELTHVEKAFNEVRATSDVTLAVDPTPHVLGLIGPNGAGKTTLVNLCTGYARPDSGTITFRGEDIAGRRPHELAALGLARTYQNMRLFSGMTVRENVSTGRHLHDASRRLAVLRPRGRRRDEVVETILERLRLGELADSVVDELSYGQRRRVEIGRALATECSMLVLDEPVAGMTVQEADEIGDFLRELVAEGVHVLLVEHNIALVTRICDDVAVLNWGRLIARGPARDIWNLDEVRTAYIGARREVPS